MARESAASGQERRGRVRHRSVMAGLMAILPAFHLRARQVAVALLVICLSLAPMPLASAHDAMALSTAEAERHAALLAQEIAEHGHSHDDGEAHEQSAGHTHGHDPADHSHQFGFFPVSASQWGLPSSQRWPTVLADLPEPATGVGIDRPPKQAMSL